MSVAGFRLEYETGTGSVESFAVAFERLADSFDNFGEFVFPLLVPVLEAEIAAQFDAEGHGPSGAWADLSPDYAAVKAVTYPGQPILRATNSLWHALTDSGSVNALRDFSRDSFNFGTRGLPYAEFHQTGTGRMPRRPPLDFRPSIERSMQRIGAQAIREMVRAANLPDDMVRA